MSLYQRKKQVRGNRGQTLVEFALSAVLLVMLLIGVVEMCRMVLVYNSLSDGARIGVRYAMVHGSDNLASTSQIQTTVKNFLSGMDTSQVTVTPSYPGGTCGSTGHEPGCRVKVTVSYPYAPMTNYFPLNVTLSSTSEGVITF